MGMGWDGRGGGRRKERGLKKDGKNTSLKSSRKFKNEICFFSKRVHLVPLQDPAFSSPKRTDCPEEEKKSVHKRVLGACNYVQSDSRYVSSRLRRCHCNRLCPLFLFAPVLFRDRFRSVGVGWCWRRCNLGAGWCALKLSSCLPCTRRLRLETSRADVYASCT